MGKLFWRHCSLWLVALSLCGCGGGDSGGRSGRPVTLFAAASTTNALDEIREEFKRATGTDVKASYASSSMLAQQIAYGAEADVFVSASTQWADHLDQKALVKRRRDLLKNRLVIIVPADSQLDVQKPEDLMDKAVRRLALADYTAVPAGIYAREALTKMGLWEQLRGKVVSGADVRQALAYVQSGAADAGLVYATDAAVCRSVKIVAEISTELAEPIYAVVLLKPGESKGAAAAFYRYLNSPEAAEVFRKHGFVVRSGSIAGG